MDTTLISNRILGFMKQYEDISVHTKNEIATNTIEIVGNFFYDFFVPGAWQLKDIERIGTGKLIFYWTSSTENAVCPECEADSHKRAKIYKTRSIQDLPISGMSVYHKIKANRYYCENPACQALTFVEQFREIADKDSRFSHRLKDFAIQETLESSCNGTAKALKAIGARISVETITRAVKKKGSTVVEQNLQRDDVKVLSVDDINLRKGNSSTACSVFIDAETHRVLAIVQGATGERAQQVMEQYPAATKVSRDRGTAYSHSATACGKTQVADRFHLVQNIHKTVKDVLSLEIAHDLFIREGVGWIRMVDSAHETPAVDVNEPEEDDGLVVIAPATLAEDDRERRIHLAGLTNNKADTYRKTLKVLEMTECGLRTVEIARRLSMKRLDVLRYKRQAVEIIGKVEEKIDEYYTMDQQGSPYRQKFLGNHLEPSSKSIVQPYKETVVRMLAEGETHRTIYPVIVQEGFTGSPNAVYQYLLKYTYENNIPYGRNARVIPPKERNAQSLQPRPPRITIKRIARKTLYEYILHEATAKRKEFQQAMSGEEDLVVQHCETTSTDAHKTPVEWVNTTNYSDNIARIICNTQKKDRTVKKN